jgi:hypothetical protein
MFVSCIPGEPYVVTRLSLAETLLPHRNRLTSDLAQNNAVGPEVLDSLYARRLTVLRHDLDMLGSNADEAVVL